MYNNILFLVISLSKEIDHQLSLEAHLRGQIEGWIEGEYSGNTSHQERETSHTCAQNEKSR